MDVDCQQASAGETAPLRPTLRARGCASAASSLSSSRHHALPTAVELLISLVDGGSATSMAGSARRWQENETTQAAGGCGATHESARACCHWPVLAPGAHRSWLSPPPFLCCYRCRCSAATTLEEIPGGMEPRPAVVACTNPPPPPSPHLRSSLAAGTPCPPPIGGDPISTQANDMLQSFGLRKNAGNRRFLRARLWRRFWLARVGFACGPRRQTKETAPRGRKTGLSDPGKCT
jgi:hypothetical protein